MKAGALKNATTSFLFVALAVFAGVFAYSSPGAVEAAASPAISALSVIFGLSIAISTLALSSQGSAAPLTNDPLITRQMQEKISGDNNRTLTRQKSLTWTALAALMLGLVFLASFEKAPYSTPTRLIAALFTTSSSAALLFTLHLPNLLSLLALRNGHLSRNS